MKRNANAITAAARSYPSLSVPCAEHPHCKRVGYLYRTDSCDTQMAAKVGVTDGLPLYEKVGGTWRVKLT